MQSIEEGIQQSCGGQAETQNEEPADNQDYALKSQPDSSIESIRETWLEEKQNGKPVGYEAAHATNEQKRKVRERDQREKSQGPECKYERNVGGTANKRHCHGRPFWNRLREGRFQLAETTCLQ